MNRQDIEVILLKHQQLQKTDIHPIEFSISKNKIESMITNDPRFEQFKDLKITDELVIEIALEFFNSGGWDVLEVYKWMKKTNNFMIEEYASKVVAQLVNEPEKLKKCSCWIRGI